jgi:phage antirepressor YoqD-like protein
MAVLMTSAEVCGFLGITRNNLYQIQYRKQIVWVKKVGKNALYDREQVEAYKLKRDKHSS